MTARGSVCVRVKCSLTLSTCLPNELAFQQNACKTGQEVSSAKRLALAVLVQNLVIGSETSRDLSPFLTSCKPFFAHARSQRMEFDDYGIRDRFLRAKMSNEKKSIMVCPPPQVQKESDLEKEARFLANPFSSFPIFYLSKPNEPK